MSKLSLTVSKLSIAAALVLGASVGTANAQSLAKGTFTLPYEVRWGKAVLQPGSYVVTIDSARGPAFVRTLNGDGRAIVMGLAEGAMKEHPSALVITKSENQRVVRYLNLREVDKSIAYEPFTKAERKLVGQLDETEAVPILMAQK